MRVVRDQRQFILLSNSSDPNVIFGNWTPFFTEQIFNLAVLLGSRGIANEYSICRCELIDYLKVRFHTVGLHAGSLEEGDKDIRVEEKATTQ